MCKRLAASGCVLKLFSSSSSFTITPGDDDLEDKSRKSALILIASTPIVFLFMGSRDVREDANSLILIWSSAAAVNELEQKKIE